MPAFLSLITFKLGKRVSLISKLHFGSGLGISALYNIKNNA